MPKTKIREITLVQDKGAFSIFKKQTADKSEYDFEGIQALRQLLSNEKARMLNVIKTQNPTSIYDLAKKLKRNFKSVNDDIKLLERFKLIKNFIGNENYSVKILISSFSTCLIFSGFNFPALYSIFDLLRVNNTDGRIKLSLEIPPD